ncbi:MAG: extensin family protein [Xanthobacteraceae bacterium]|nr:MAG: extensin family protein [Xanthobacteraceae bacterium]
MTRGARLFVVGSVALVTLAGCGRGWFAEREPWRREAEEACLKSGMVREGVNIVRVEPISGPGVCGADYPLKVAALGANSSLGFADNPRPPGTVPGGPRGQPAWPLAPAQASPLPPQPAYPPPAGAPVSLSAPGIAPPPADDAMIEPDGLHRLPQQAPPSPPRLGPSRPAMPTGAAPVAVTPAATLACPMVSELDRWIAESVQPAALRWFGAPVGEIKQISAYSCRGMNGSRSAHISEHAFGNALDIAAFTLVDGRRISVKDGWNGLPEEQGFLRDVQGAACQQFNTVLAPGSNIYHYDHIHVDLMRRASGRVICQPGAVAGEAVAARASQRGRYANRDPGITGALGRKIAAPFRRPVKDRDDDDDWIEDESRIR